MPLGIAINLSADVAKSMLEAKQRLRAKAYIAALPFAIEVLIGAGLFLLFRRTGPLLAGWSLFVGLSASIVALLGAAFAMNAAEFVRYHPI